MIFLHIAAALVTFLMIWFVLWVFYVALSSLRDVTVNYVIDYADLYLARSEKREQPSFALIIDKLNRSELSKFGIICMIGLLIIHMLLSIRVLIWRKFRKELTKLMFKKGK